ncbi:MAG: SGNH/GDSL hydrolase family protein [Bacteroidota bacterium]
MIKLILILTGMFLTPLFQRDKSALKYIAFGDSYTICTGTNAIDEQWPTILSKHLTEAGIKTDLVANPSKNGYSTQNVIDYELPLLKNQTLDFATLLIGVNDWVRQVDMKTYHKNLNYCIDEIQKHLSNKNHLLLITIPDFGVTPQGKLYGNGRNISEGISEFNDIIKTETKKRGLVCVDVFTVSQQMKNNKDLVAADGLHPSAKEYAVWETMIFSEAKKLLSK